jgi:murein DD-endopeptidase MepM/ murein hydrolase activator NlpD
VIRGFSRPGTGDALDVFVPAGTPVRAMHSGHVTRIAQGLGRLGCVYVEAADIISVYAHLHVRIPTPERDGLKVGDHVEEGQLLGWVGRILNDPHLHLEVWIKGKALAAPAPAELAQKINLVITGVEVHAS